MKKLDFLSDLLRRRFAISGMRAEAVNPDSQPTVNRRSTLTSVQRQPEISARSAREWLKYAAVLIMLVTLGVENAWGATTYKLTQVSSVSAGNKYVFVQDGYAMNNSVSSNALQCTNSYSTTGLTGTETYVWLLETATDGLYMKNVSKNSNEYLKTSSTSCSFAAKSNTPGIFTFTFSSNICLIEVINNLSNNKPRFLGYTNSTSHAYKAYANSNLNNYPHAITVYRLDEESDCTNPTISVHPASDTYTKGDTPDNLSVTASGTSLTYQWYSNTTATNSGGTSLTGQTSSTYTPSTSSAGTFYYYCVVSSGSCSTSSNVATITVNAPTHKAYFYNGTTLLNTGGTDIAEGAVVSYSGATPVSCDTGTGASTTFVGWATSTWDGKKAAKANIPVGTTFYDIVGGESLPVMGVSDVTYYAVFAYGSSGGSSSWVETDFADLTSSDVFVLATPAGYALPSNGGNAKPVVSAITVSNGEITSAVADGLKWNMSGNSTDGYTFYPNGTTSSWLSCTTNANSGTNDNIRITDNASYRNVWTTDANGLKTKDSYVARWLCCYNSADFRGYVSASQTGDNISICYKYTSGTTYSNYMTTCAAPTQVATPTFSPDGGTYDDDQTVTISCETANAAIYYTLTTDGSTPTDPTSSSTPYSSTITIDHNNTKIKAIAIKADMTDSEIASATYLLTCATPTYSPAAGNFCGSEDVTLSCTTDGATIHYTTDGSTTPTESSPTYSTAIPLSATTTIKAKAFKSNYTASAEASATYTNTALTTMDAIYSAATSSEVATCITFNNWVISGVSDNGKNVYLTDGTKGLIIYNNGGNSGFAVGDILSGSATCNLKMFNNSAELVGLTSTTTGLSVSTGGTAAATVVDASAISALEGINTGRVVTTTGVCSEDNSKFYINGAQIYNQLLPSASYTDPTPGVTYTVTGVYLQYGATQEILPLSNLTTFTITAQSNNNSYGTVSVSNGVITATPASGYRVSTTTPYEVTSGSASVTDNGDNTFTVSPSSNCTVQINFEAIPTHTLTFSINGGSCATSSVSVAEGATYSPLPSVTDLTSSCEYGTFVGWTTESSTYVHGTSTLYTTSYEMGNANVTLHAVYSKTSGGGGTTEETASVVISTYASDHSWVNDTQYSTVDLDENITATADGGSNTGKYYSSGTTWRLYQSESATITISAGSGCTLKSVTFSYSSDKQGTLKDGSTNVTTGYAQTISGTSKTYDVGNTGSATNGQVRITAISVTYDKTSGGTTSYSLDANCCTPLAAIKEKVTYSNPTSAVVGWHKDANVASYTLRYKTHDAGTWTTAWANKVAGTDSEISLTDRVGSSSGTNDSCYATITTACGTAYDFRIVANPTSGHCPDSVQIDNQNSGSYTVTATHTGITPASAFPSTTCNGFSISGMTVDDANYHLPNTIIVSGADHTWNNTSGALTISNVTGNVTITINKVENACTHYSFHWGVTMGDEDQVTCLNYVAGTTDTYRSALWTVPTTGGWTYVGWQGGWHNDNAKSANLGMTSIPYDKNHSKTLSRAEVGNVGGAQGYIQVYANSTDYNKYVGFLPAGYVVRILNSSSVLQSTKTMVSKNGEVDDNNWHTSDIFELTSDMINGKYDVDLKTADGYVWAQGRSLTSNVAGMKIKNGNGTYRATDIAAGDAGTRGRFAIFADSGDDNWYCHFVPYYHVTYNGNGALSGSTAASADVSCEGDASARTVNAAVNGFTGPAHTTFGGWATSASGTKVYDENDPITLTADVELFAIWEPEANATITLNNYTGSPAPTDKYAGDTWNLPSENTYVCGEKTFVGWSTVTISTPVNTKPVSNFYEPGASVTLAATNTFYAVFADVDEGTWTLDYATETALSSSTDWGSYGTAYNYTAADGGEWVIKANKNSGMQINSGKNSSIKIPDCSGNITSIVVTGGNRTVRFSQTDYDGSTFGTIDVTGSDSYTQTLDFTGKSITSGYIVPNTNANAITNIVVNYGSTSAYSTTCVACETVTVAYTTSPTGGTVGVKKGVTNIAPNGTVNVCGSAVALTVTLTPAEHYTATGLTAVLGSTPLSPTNVGNVYTVTLPADATTSTLTLTPTFTAETPLTITFDVSSVSGVTAGSIGTIYSGDDFDFPNVSGVPVGFCADFLGWVDATNGTTFDGDGTTTTEPAELIEVGDNSGPITTNKTYKAVYGEPETEEVEAYFKVTSTPADWENDHYLIVYEDGNVAFDGSLSTLDAVENTVDVTISSGVIAYSSALAASEFRIAEITGGYSIQSASGYYIGQTSDANGMATNSSDAYANALTISSGDFDATSSSAHLRYNSAANQLRFRYFKSATYSSQNAVQLYKLGTDNVVTYTYTTAPSCGDKYRVTVASVTGGSPSASPKYCADGTTISLVANPANGYSFTSWTITKDADDSNVTTTLLGDNSTTASTSFTMPAYDVTVTAAYSITNYNITYNNLNGATNSNPATYNVASADIVFVDPGARAGYIFKGWYDDAVYTNQVTGIPNGSTGAVTVYAKWAVGYTITWDNAIGVNPASTGVEDGQAIGTLPTPTGSCTFDGTTYSNFVGWYTGTISSVGTAASDAGTEITAATVPTANATYHAVYTNMPDYSGTNTSNVTLPASPSSPVSTAKIKVSSEDDAPEYDGIKIGTSKNKTGSFTFTVPSGTTKITLHGVAWSGKTASVTLATSVGTISPSTAQSLDDNSGASDNSPFTITSNTTLTFNLANVSSEATITVSNSSERVIVWGINASSASGSDVGYITSCCDNLLAAPTMNSPTVRTSTAITLSWNTVPNATGYKVSWNGGDWEDVGTATTYEKTSLEPGNDYSYKVIAKYTSPYCGASAYEGVVSTKPVYSVTYERGSGTGSCSATGSIPAVAYYEEGATVSLAASNTFSLSGNTFDAWSSEQVALTASSTSFTMPAEDVIITATWMANVDKFYDRMHNLTSGEGSHTDAQGKHYITREGCSYTVPALEDNTDGETACHTSHYVLLGWIAGGHLDSEGKVKSGEESYIFTGGGTKTAGGNTYYAVWAEVTE